MTTILTKENSNAYAIYVDGHKVVECMDPETSANELIKNIGIDTTKVQVMEIKGETFPPKFWKNHIQETGSENIVQSLIHDELEDRQPANLDDIINQVNAGITAPNLGKHDRRLASQEFANQVVSENEHTSQTTVNTGAPEPVGNISIPKIGDLVYVNGIDGILRKVTGGIGTVHMVYVNNAEVVTGSQTVVNPDYDPDFDEDDDEFTQEDITESNILVELEEVPGVYFGWNEVHNKQVELKAKYGYKPVCAIV